MGWSFCVLAGCHSLELTAYEADRYLHDHEQQLARDKELNKLQATAKYRERNRFNPLSQQYTDGDENLRMRTWEESHKIEAVEKAQAQMPPSIKHRPSAYWNVINHRQANADTLKMIDLAEDERKERYKNRPGWLQSLLPKADF